MTNLVNFHYYLYIVWPNLAQILLVFQDTPLKSISECDVLNAGSDNRLALKHTENGLEKQFFMYNYSASGPCHTVFKT